MGLRYRIPFKDSNNNSYEVQIFRQDYSGEVKELTGSTSCFVVSGTDEDFIYTPVRTSSATVGVLESDLLLDLYSINNQYAPVKLMKNGALEWTGFIKPEQYTQPYVAYKTNISVECVSALATLENIEYTAIENGTKVTLWELLRHIISAANGGYNAVYIPWVYGADSSMNENVFGAITLIENNFIKEEMNLLNVLESICKFLNWTAYDINGSIFFVDADWKGEYRRYDEALQNYTVITPNNITIQDIGYKGSDSNSLDVIHGFNKVKVKAINNVFSDVVKDEDFDQLEHISQRPFVEAYEGADGPHAVRKIFLKPKTWMLYQYSDQYSGALSKDEVYTMSSSELNKLYGAVMLQECDYRCVSLRDTRPAEGVTDYNYVDTIQIRVNDESNAQVNIMGTKLAVRMEAEYAVYADCAISIEGTIDGYWDNDMLAPSYEFANRTLNILVECDGKYYNGTEWVSSYATVTVEVDPSGRIKSNRTPLSPYKGIEGYIIPIEYFIGKPVISIFCPAWSDGMGLYTFTGSKIRNLKFGYAKKEGVIEDGEKGDRIYENIVNESYMSEADEIEFEISSYNADGASFSKAILNGSWLTNNLYCAVVDENVRPEELLIRRIVNRYEATKIKLTEAIQMTSAINPLTTLLERSLPQMKFRLTSGEWDYEEGKIIIQIQEDIDEKN